jgi:hypothetical protein
MSTNASTTLSVHLHDGEIVGEVDHSEHEHSGGLYPVVKLNLGGFELTVFPGRKRAEELARTFESMASVLRTGAAHASVEALAD